MISPRPHSLHRRLTQATFGGALGVALMTAMLVASPSGSALAAPGCAPSTPSGSPVATAAVSQAALPTQAPVEAEQNPPGDIPDNQAFVTFTSQEGGYSITMPEGWARQEDGADVTFSDKLHEFSIHLACASSAPTVDSAKTEANGPLAASTSAFELVDIKSVSLPAGPAVLIHYRENSQPDEVTGKQHRLDVDRYEIYKDGTVAIVTLASPAGSDNVDVSRQVSESFRWNG